VPASCLAPQLIPWCKKEGEGGFCKFSSCPHSHVFYTLAGAKKMFPAGKKGPTDRIFYPKWHAQEMHLVHLKVLSNKKN